MVYRAAFVLSFVFILNFIISCDAIMTYGYYLEKIMKALSLKLPDTTFRRLSSEAVRRHINRSEIVRRAIEYYFEHERNAVEDSFYEAASSLCKKFKGPQDL